ncbi:MAG: hypothetical protein A3H70_02135 [Candidatus Komeilibacteria bacterium RIFCSPLOWO2_02_FULL_48_11]|uniref:Uncharacterized protein n=1 Tax=Candidatus Komeilibacteria bacterium RIFCSPLOWO2_02_FULL_48_11 TaxID=1798553 RepID=A0A1G2BUC2_9BACT|nr:MAG: hypothetical protein A3H70_02135 [Candidatus Komeilibacteria bacterium RIFCSPLOWO2_02_FULL_48_11]
MKKLIYKNLISMIIFFLLPMFYFENGDKYGIPDVNPKLVYVFIFAGVFYLLFLNVKSIKLFRGKGKLIPIFFILIPSFVILYFILGYIAFSRYTILG